MKCWHPECTGVHDNNRYHELCPSALDAKRDKDNRYYARAKGMLSGFASTKVWHSYSSTLLSLS